MRAGESRTGVSGPHPGNARLGNGVALMRLAFTRIIARCYGNPGVANWRYGTLCATDALARLDPSSLRAGTQQPLHATRINLTMGRLSGLV